MEHMAFRTLSGRLDGLTGQASSTCTGGASSATDPALCHTGVCVAGHIMGSSSLADIGALLTGVVCRTCSGPVRRAVPQALGFLASTPKQAPPHAFAIFSLQVEACVTNQGFDLDSITRSSYSSPCAGMPQAHRVIFPSNIT